MDKQSIFDAVQEIFRDNFDDEELVITRETCADDIEDWDSLEQINLLTAMENLTAEGEMPTQQPSQTPAPTTQPDDGKVPQTGDTMNVAAYLFTAVVCAAGLAVLVIFRKKNA